MKKVQRTQLPCRCTRNLRIGLTHTHSPLRQPTKRKRVKNGRELHRQPNEHVQHNIIIYQSGQWFFCVLFVSRSLLLGYLYEVKGCDIHPYIYIHVSHWSTIANVAAAAKWIKRILVASLVPVLVEMQRATVCCTPAFCCCCACCLVHGGLFLHQPNHQALKGRAPQNCAALFCPISFDGLCIDAQAHTTHIRRTIFHSSVYTWSFAYLFSATAVRLCT